MFLHKLLVCVSTFATISGLCVNFLRRHLVFPPDNTSVGLFSSEIYCLLLTVCPHFLFLCHFYLDFLTMYRFSTLPSCLCVHCLPRHHFLCSFCSHNMFVGLFSDQTYFPSIHFLFRLLSKFIVFISFLSRLFNCMWTFCSDFLSVCLLST